VIVTPEGKGVRSKRTNPAWLWPPALIGAFASAAFASAAFATTLSVTDDTYTDDQNPLQPMGANPAVLVGNDLVKAGAVRFI
jgi:hypothetical protein